MRARAGSGCASGCTRISAACGDDDRSRVRDVLSLTVQSPDGQPLTAALPGQYVVLRLQPTAGGPPLFRSYSLSGPLSEKCYRISVKIEPNGRLEPSWKACPGRTIFVHVSSPRGSFILQSGERAVVLLSAGIGVTPVLAMLHALAASRSRAGLVLHALAIAASSVCRRSQPADARAHALPQLVCYSRPDWRQAGKISTLPVTCRKRLRRGRVPREADVHLRRLANMHEAR